MFNGDFGSQNIHSLRQVTLQKPFHLCFWILIIIDAGFDLNRFLNSLWSNPNNSVWGYISINVESRCISKFQIAPVNWAMTRLNT